MASSFLAALVLVLSFFNTVYAHTWIEQLSLISSNGTYTGAYGYPRGYIARTDAGFHSQDYLIPQLSTGRTRINASDLLCSEAQRSTTQPANYPRLTVAPGSAVAMKYLENGHVSLPANQPGKPPMGGTVFVFGTTQPYNDETLVDVLQWTGDGKGGDGRGYLLAANNYDDGRCRQVNSGTISQQRQQEYPDPIPGQPGTNHELWCETDLVLPTDTTKVPIGKVLTIYWIWQWPTHPNEPSIPGGKDEYYTACLDFQVAAQEQDGPIANTLQQQDPNTVAVSGYLSRTAITPTPDVAMATESVWTFSSWQTYVQIATATTSMQAISALTSSRVVPTAAPAIVATSAVFSASSTASSTAELTTTSTQTSTSYVRVTSTVPMATYNIPSGSIGRSERASTSLSTSTLTIASTSVLGSTELSPSSLQEFSFSSQATSTSAIAATLSTSSQSTPSLLIPVPIPTTLLTTYVTTGTSTTFSTTSAVSTGNILGAILRGSSIPIPSTTTSTASSTISLVTTSNPLGAILGGSAGAASSTTSVAALSSLQAQHHALSSSALTTATDAEYQTLTAVVTVVATMPPGQSIMVVKGSHVVTFTAPLGSATSASVLAT